MKDLLRLLRLTRGHREIYVAAAVALAVGSLAFLFVPPLLGRFLAALPDAAAGRSGRHITYAMGIAALLILNGAASLVYTFLVSWVSERSDARSPSSSAHSAAGSSCTTSSLLRLRRRTHCCSVRGYLLPRPSQ